MTYFNTFRAGDTYLIIDLVLKQAVYEAKCLDEALTLVVLWNNTTRSIAEAEALQENAQRTIVKQQNECKHQLKTSEPWSNTGDLYSNDTYGAVHVCQICKKQWSERTDG